MPLPLLIHKKENNTMNKSLIAVAVATALGAAAPVFALTLDESNGKTVSLDIESMVGNFSTSEDYLGEGGKDWQEAYLKAVLNGAQSMDGGTLYGGLGAIALGTFGDGDAGGYTNGDESRVALDSAFVGWKTADESIDFSVGRQIFQLGDGFLIAGDAISLGEGLEDAFGVDIDRGGAYYLAGQKSFSNTAILRFDPAGNLRGDLFWLKSDNPFHQDTTLAGLNLEWVSEQGTLAASYLDILSVEEDEGLALWNKREGMKVLSLRGNGNAGVENLFLSAEYVQQSGGDTDVENDGNAWYVEAGWTFADAPWTPNLNARYASFSGDDASTTDSEAFDPLFFGFTRGFGTWFQGEVASNYSGPANSGNDVTKVELSLFPSESLMIGLQSWQFTPQDDADDTAGDEIDLYAMWTINDNIIFSPLVGWYTPKGDTVKTNQGNDDTNFYAQAVLMLFY